MDVFRPVTKEAAAEILSVSVRTIENWITSGTMPAPASIAGRRYWHPKVFFAWLDHALAISAAPSDEFGAQVPSVPPEGNARKRTTPQASNRQGKSGGAVERHEARREVLAPV